MNSSNNKITKMVRETFSQQQMPRAQKPETKVQFDSKTDSPFVVTFSKRGFSIDNTRLSFEVLEDALSKEYSIVLNNGQGMVLDGVKMQKIMRYKNLY